MTAEGYKGIMVKDEVAEKVRAMAKKEGKTISAFLDEVLYIYDKGGNISEISDKSILRIGADIRRIIREELEELTRR